MLIQTRFTKAFGMLQGGSRLTSAGADYPDFSVLLGTDVPVHA